MPANEKQLATAGKSADDALTLISLGIIAFAIAIVTHEGLGHGLTAIAAGAKPVILTTCNFDWRGTLRASSIKWIAAAGCLANAIAGLLAALALHRMRAAGPSIRYFCSCSSPSTCCLPRAIRGTPA
jgi:hypothetical protein